MKADVLKKNHYWIVAGTSVLLVLIAFFSLGGVGTAIEAKQGEIKDAESKARSAQAPGAAAIKAIEKQKSILEAKKDELWRENWDRQKGLFTWPEASGKPFAAYASLKFGADLPQWTADPYQYADFQKPEVYKALYEKMATDIAPTKFLGGWPTVLSDYYIAVWPARKPEPRQIWLALENTWVIKELLKPIASVNEEARKFRHLTDLGVANLPLKKTFANTTWTVAVEVVTKDQVKMVTGKITNRTKQMQLLGTDNRLKLKVQLDPESKNAFEFEVQGEYVPGDTTIEIPPQVIGAGFNVTEIVSLEQNPDARTVPIRQVEKMALSLVPNQFGIYNKATLLPPSFWPEDAATDPNAAASGATPTPVMGGRPEIGGRGELPALPGGAIPGLAPGSAGLGTIDSVTTDQRKRYLEITNQFRRMPVAVKLVLDHRYVQDVMVAYTNSPLRLQLVQYHWARYRGDLGSATPEGSVPSGGGPTVAAGGGGIVSSDMPTIAGSLGAELGRGGRGGRRGERDRGEMLPAPGAGGPIPLMPQPELLPGIVSGALTSVSEAQANSSLVELYLFGIVTIYEKPDAKTDAAGSPEPAKTDPVAEPKPEPKVEPKADPKTDGTPPMTPPETPPRKEQAPAPAKKD